MLRKPTELQTALLLGQCEHREHAAKLRVLVQCLVGTYRAETVGVTLESRCHADARPATDAGQHADVLLAAMRPGVDVADDAGRGLEAIQLLTRLRIDCL